jgi:hypothetical protein
MPVCHSSTNNIGTTERITTGIGCFHWQDAEEDHSGVNRRPITTRVSQAASFAADLVWVKIQRLASVQLRSWAGHSAGRLACRTARAAGARQALLAPVDPLLPESPVSALVGAIDLRLVRQLARFPQAGVEGRAGLVRTVLAVVAIGPPGDRIPDRSRRQRDPRS